MVGLILAQPYNAIEVPQRSAEVIINVPSLLRAPVVILFLFLFFFWSFSVFNFFYLFVLKVRVRKIEMSASGALVAIFSSVALTPLSQQNSLNRRRARNPESFHSTPGGQLFSYAVFATCPLKMLK